MMYIWAVYSKNKKNLHTYNNNKINRQMNQNLDIHFINISLHTPGKQGSVLGNPKNL